MCVWYGVYLTIAHARWRKPTTDPDISAPSPPNTRKIRKKMARHPEELGKIALAF